MKLVLLFLIPAMALAHQGQPVEPHDLAGAWTWDPGVVIPLALSAFLYWRGLAPGRGIRRWEARAFAWGWLTLFVSLVSPLHAMGEELFSAHMVQHELIMLIAAPMLVLGRPLVPFLWALPAAWRRTAGGWGRAWPVRIPWRAMTTPWVAWAVHGAALWVWHAPPLFEATLRSEFAHALQHISFLASALLFWWALLRGRERRMGYGAGTLYLFTTLVHTGFLGALLTISPVLWYPAYRGGTAAWGLTPLEDQQLGGLIMWVPASLVYLLAGIAMLAAWLRESDERAASWWKARASAGEIQPFRHS